MFQVGFLEILLILVLSLLVFGPDKLPSAIKSITRFWYLAKSKIESARSEFERDIFKTAFEIDQMAILRLASQRQRFIDQGQSLNLFFSADEDEEYIAKIHKEFFLDERLKGLYYIRSQAGVQAAKDECAACEA